MCPKKSFAPGLKAYEGPHLEPDNMNIKSGPGSNKRKQNPEYGYSIDSLGHGESNEQGLAGPTHNFNNASGRPDPLPNATSKLADEAM